MVSRKPKPRPKISKRKLESIRNRKRTKYDLGESELLEKARMGALFRKAQKGRRMRKVSIGEISSSFDSFRKGETVFFERRLGKLRPVHSQKHSNLVARRLLHLKTAPLFSDRRILGKTFRGLLEETNVRHFRRMEDLARYLPRMMVHYQRLVELGGLEIERIRVTMKHVLDVLPDSPRKRKRLLQLSLDAGETDRNKVVFERMVKDIPVALFTCLSHADRMRELNLYNREVSMARKILRGSDERTKLDNARSYLRARINRLRSLQIIFNEEINVSRLLGVEIGDFSVDDKVALLRATVRELNRARSDYKLLS